MERFQFGDKVKTSDGKEGIVQEDQELHSEDVKVMLEGDEYAHVFKQTDLELITGQS